MPEVGDQVRVRSTKIGQAEREGVVTQVQSYLLRVQWSTGEESTFTPGPGSLTVVGGSRAASKKAAAASTKKRATVGNKKTAKKPVAKKNAAPRKAR
jgi:hypothetical protein